MEDLAILPLEELCELAQQLEVIDECVFSDCDVMIQIGSMRLYLPHHDAKTFAQGLLHGHLRTVSNLPYHVLIRPN